MEHLVIFFFFNWQTSVCYKGYFCQPFCYSVQLGAEQPSPAQCIALKRPCPSVCKNEAIKSLWMLINSHTGREGRRSPYLTSPAHRGLQNVEFCIFSPSVGFQCKKNHCNVRGELSNDSPCVWAPVCVHACRTLDKWVCICLPPRLQRGCRGCFMW